MAEFTLIAEPGRATGSPDSRRLRAAGRIPAVVYGHGVDGISVSVDGRELRHALSGDAGLNQLLSLKVGPETHLALARAIQRHPVRHTVLHVDFQVVRRDQVISAEVPVVLTGEAKSVEQENGIVEQVLVSIAVNATPGRIPSNIEVDISGLTVGEGIRVGDLPLPEGVTTDVSPDEPVVMASVTRAAVGEEAAEAEAAAEE
ncbi:MAG TPA: 50S ribosomal protein L25, partial [Acidimicrobiales bacterium]|nr:50S ribosomal protein L25 [Acidimicrobiales bacterium]